MLTPAHPQHCKQIRRINRRNFAVVARCERRGNQVAKRLRRLFTTFECTAELNAELLQSAVSAVLVTRQTVRLQLKNGQIIGKEDLV